MLLVAMYVPWCRYLDELPGLKPQLCADNLKCVGSDPVQLLRADRFPLGMFGWLGRSLLLPGACSQRACEIGWSRMRLSG